MVKSSRSYPRATVVWGSVPAVGQVGAALQKPRDRITRRAAATNELGLACRLGCPVYGGRPRQGA